MKGLNFRNKKITLSKKKYDIRPSKALAETQTQLWEGPREQTSGAAEQPGHIGRYKVIGTLGRGGFGTVYRARDEELQRDVAIKVWRRDRFAGNEAVEQLVAEARHVARLEKHPAIVGVYDVGRQEDGSVFMVLQYIEGHSLAQELKSHKLAPDRVWQIMLQVTSAIQHAHATGLVHRDLKPANVLLDADGNAHVADFGLARADRSYGGRDWVLIGELLSLQKERKFVARQAALIASDGTIIHGAELLVPADDPGAVTVVKKVP